MKYLFVFIALSFCMYGNQSCIKDGCTDIEPINEEALIIAYAGANGITAIKHSSGLFYEIINAGSGTQPTAASTVTVKYTGKLTTNVIFDQQITTGIIIPLPDVIDGWKIGLPLIRKGGIIKLIIPSALGYGCEGLGTVPPNSILYFEVELIDVQ